MTLKKFCISNVIALILGLISLIGTFFGVFFFLDDRYASAKDTDMKVQKVVTSVDKLSLRMDLNLLDDQEKRVNEKIDRIKSEYPNPKKMPKLIKEELEELELKRKVIDNKLQKMEEQIYKIDPKEIVR